MEKTIILKRSEQPSQSEAVSRWRTRVVSCDFDGLKNASFFDRIAENYDESYGHEGFATSEFMEFEEKYLDDLLNRNAFNSINGSVAIELGFGTGRHSVKLTKNFWMLIGVDYSEKMCEITEKKFANAGLNSAGVISLHSGFDVNKRPLREAFYRAGFPSYNADFVLGAFGMGSFIENIEEFSQNSLTDIIGRNGLAYLNFYNRNSLACTAGYDDRAALNLTTIPLPEKNKIAVKGERGMVDCIYYSPDELREIFLKDFDNVTIRTHLNTLLTCEPDKTDECRGKDEELFWNGDMNGYYICVELSGSKHKRDLRSSEYAK